MPPLAAPAAEVGVTRAADNTAVHNAVNADVRAVVEKKFGASGGTPSPLGTPFRAGAPAQGGAALQANSMSRLLSDARCDADSLVGRELAKVASVSDGTSVLISSCVALLLLLRSLAEAPGALPRGAVREALADAAQALRPRASCNQPLYDQLLVTMAELQVQLGAVAAM